MAYRNNNPGGRSFTEFLGRYRTEDMVDALKRYDVLGKSRDVIVGCFASYVFALEASGLLERAYDAQILRPSGPTPRIADRLAECKSISRREALRNPIVVDSVKEVRRRLNENAKKPGFYQEDRTMANFVLLEVTGGRFNI